jgi:hypothetical protein
LICKKELEAEISRVQGRLLHLHRVQERGFLSVPSLKTRSPDVQIQDFRGFLIPHKTVNEVQQTSHGKAVEAHSMFLLGEPNPQVNHLHHLPFFRFPFEAHDELMEPIYTVVANWRSIVSEKCYSLALEYAERKGLWDLENQALCAYSHEKRVCLDQWPPEFSKATLKTNESVIMNRVGQDQPMFLDELEGRSCLFYDYNALVEDPVLEHKAYRKRLAWTESEIKIFMERYAQHPREFKRISASLPAKSIKDVIEFYHIHRIEYGLGAIEKASRKRGRKKVITEGMIRS